MFKDIGNMEKNNFLNICMCVLIKISAETQERITGESSFWWQNFITFTYNENEIGI